MPSLSSSTSWTSQDGLWFYAKTIAKATVFSAAPLIINTKGEEFGDFGFFRVDGGNWTEVSYEVAMGIETAEGEGEE